MLPCRDLTPRVKPRLCHDRVFKYLTWRRTFRTVATRGRSDCAQLNRDRWLPNFKRTPTRVLRIRSCRPRYTTRFHRSLIGTDDSVSESSFGSAWTSKFISRTFSYAKLSDDIYTTYFAKRNEVCQTRVFYFLLCSSTYTFLLVFLIDLSLRLLAKRIIFAFLIFLSENAIHELFEESFRHEIATNDEE